MRPSKNMTIYLTSEEAKACIYICGKTPRAFENMKEMKKTRAAGECFLHFSSFLKCLESYQSVIYGLLGFFICFMM